MKISRVWAMPNKWTFQIKPIAELVHRYVGDGKGWIDPFAGMTSPAEFTNDLNCTMPTKYHLPASKFILELTGMFRGILFDPPYSLGQIKQCYENHGLKFAQTDAQLYNSKLKGQFGKLIQPAGYALTFGWNSCGFGKTNGFELVEILLVSHGRDHNDTICTVEQKTQPELNI